MSDKRFVYILRSDTHPEHHYVGITSDVGRRLQWHNTGPVGVTRRHRPWSLVVALEFTDATTAGRFERYLKTGTTEGVRAGNAKREHAIARCVLRDAARQSAQRHGARPGKAQVVE